MDREQVNILVVDDEEIVRNLLQRTLRGAGYDVVTAANGQEALDKVSQLPIEAVLLDIKMPGMSGMEVLQWLTANRPDTCVVMVTAVTDVQTAIKAMKMGAYDYITKPFDQKEVLEKLQEALRKRKSLLERDQLVSELQQSIREKSRQMREQMEEPVRTLAREHALLCKLGAMQSDGGKSALSKLPPELRKPMSTFEEFRDALLRILRKEKL